MVTSGLNIAEMFQLPASVQRSVLYCLVSAIKLDCDHGQVSGTVNAFMFPPTRQKTFN